MLPVNLSNKLIYDGILHLDYQLSSLGILVFIEKAVVAGALIQL